MAYTIREIADALGAEASGDQEFQIRRPSEPSRAGAEDLALAMDPSYGPALAQGQARAAVLWDGADWQSLGLTAAIFVSRPRFAMSHITNFFAVPPDMPVGIHPTAIIGPDAEIAEGASIGAYCVIGAGVRIGPNARIGSQVTIAEQTSIGADCLLYSGVRIGSFVTIGDRFAAHFNAVIGSDGFSYVTPEKSAVEDARATLGKAVEFRDQTWHRIASVASVVIGDDVEIGANSSIDKGTVASTRIGSGTKLDNQCQIGHNVVTGRDCLICGHTGVAGSAVLGDRVVLGGQSGVADHVTLGSDVIAGGASAILSNVPGGRVVMGYPAVKMDQNIENYKMVRRLPRLVRKVAELEEAVKNLSGKS